MAREITEQDLANKGVSGLPDVPGLTTEAMQKKFDEISKELLVPRFNEMAKEVNEVNENLSEVNDRLNMRYVPDIDMIQILKDGEWVDWKIARFIDTYLFDGGDNTNLTGGWKFENESTATKGRVTVGNTLGVYITDNTAGEVAQHSPRAVTNKSINVTDFAKAIITVSSYANSSGSGSSRFSIYASRDQNLGNIASSEIYNNQASASNFTVTLDLTNVAGYIYFCVSNYYSSVYISKIQLV